MIDINNLNQNEEKNKSILNLLNLIKNQFPTMTDFSLIQFFNYSKEQFENVYKLDLPMNLKEVNKHIRNNFHVNCNFVAVIDTCIF